MEGEPRGEVFKRLVDESLDKAYEDVAADIGIGADLVYAERQCEKVSEILAKELNARGFSTTVHTYRGWDVTNHDFVLTEYEGQRWVVDPTWQQFLPEADSSKPRALICPITELEECLAANGVSEDKRHIWKI